MPFNQSLPTWEKTASTPSSDKLTNGWAADEKPPASIFNWFFNTVYLALQELQQEAINVDQKGVNNGVATLDATGDLPIGQADNILNWVKALLVSATQNGLMLKDDKTKLDAITLGNAAGNAAKLDSNALLPLSNLPTGSTSAQGILQLIDSITSTDTTKAATANAAKMVVDWVKGFGLGAFSKSLASATDLNTISTNGFYYAPSATNTPVAVNGYLLVQSINATYTSQIYITNTVGDIYFRVNNNGTWTGWNKLATTALGTTSAAGLLQLVDSITSTDTTKAATANSVKMALDWVKGFGLGAGSAKDISSTDINTLTNPGFYKGNNLTNAPTGITQGYIIPVAYDSNSAFQIFVDLNGIMYIRKKSYSGGTSVWSAWTQLATYDATGKVAAANLPSATTATSGIAQLSDSISDTSTTKAATANSAKMVVDWVKGFGLGDIGKTATGTDLNTIDSTGFYVADRGNVGTLNGPGRVAGDASQIYIIHIKNQSTYKMQMAIDFNGVATWQRANINGTWGAWTQLATLDSNGDLPLVAGDNIMNWVKGFGLGDVAKDVSGTDLNNLDATGFYKGNTLTNSPLPSGSTTNFYIIHMKNSSTYYLQVAYLIVSGSPAIYTRQMNNGTWGAWTSLATTDIVNTQYINTIPADSKLNTDPPTAFPVGVSIMEVTNSSDGYPGAYLGTLMTNYVNANRVSQTFIAKSNPYTYVRSGDSGMPNGWGNWVRLASYNDFSVLLGGSGWQKLPSGLIIQWGGTGGTPINSGTPVLFPISFPTSCVTVSGNPSTATAMGTTSFTKTQFVPWFGSSSANFTWVAIGY